jgi:N-acetylglucosamine kinase-like BadF-type ATPase
VDVGGSHTRAAVSLADARVLARADGPGAPMRAGQGDRTAAAIADVVRRAAAAAGLELPAAAVVVGAAGAGSAEERDELATAVLATGVARRARALADAEVALTAAFESGPGILLNAGTGTIAFARDAAGRLHRSGGYGWQMGDEGSGYWLGRHALELAGKAYDGRSENSTLLARLLAALSLRDFDDLVRWSVIATPSQVAALAPLLLAAAADGEAVARRVVTAAADELAALVQSLTRHLRGGTPITVAATGSLVSEGSPLLGALAQSLATHVPGARLVVGPVDTPAGALRLAAALAQAP